MTYKFELKIYNFHMYTYYLSYRSKFKSTKVMYLMGYKYIVGLNLIIYITCVLQ